MELVRMKLYILECMYYGFVDQFFKSFGVKYDINDVVVVFECNGWFFGKFSKIQVVYDFY